MYSNTFDTAAAESGTRQSARLWAIDKDIPVYFKKTSVLLHSATHKLLYEEHAKNERKSFSTGWLYAELI